MKVRTAGPLGYCFGVSQAIDKAVKYAEDGSSCRPAHPVYTLGTLAHNEHVVQYLKENGVEPLPFEKPHPNMPGVWAKIALNAKVAITTHGAPPKYYERLDLVTKNVLDCTCPIVRKAQVKVEQLADQGFDIVIFGDPEHQEVIGLNGWARGAKFVGNFNQLFTTDHEFKKLRLGRKVGVISQTTKIPSMFADFVGTLLYHHIGRFNEIRIVNTICPIVAARVNETRKLAENVDMMFVVGSQESANTRNLETVCRQSMGMVDKYAVTLVQNVDQVGEALSDWFVENEMAFPRIGVTAGTSTPIDVVKEVVTKLKELMYERESGD